MNNYGEQIDAAFKEKKLFFKPWVGRRYDDGILFEGSSRPVKTLVIGASRYCRYSYEQEKRSKKLADTSIRICRYVNECCNHCDYDTLIQFSDKCPFVSWLNKKTQSFHLSDFNSALIPGNKEEVYSSFKRAIVKVIDKQSLGGGLWAHVAFVNYYQGIVWGDKQDRKKTPTRDTPRGREQYEQSEQVIVTVLEILQPDLIILWTPKSFNTAAKDGLFRKCESVVFERETTHRCNLTLNNHLIPLFLCPHPARIVTSGMKEELERFKEELRSFVKDY